MKRNNKKGFTIVELVIVIAVIAILSVVLIPTFSGVTTNAKNTARDQEAKNTYTQYLGNWDYSKGEPAYNGYFEVDGCYYIVTNGSVNLTEVPKTANGAADAIKDLTPIDCTAKAPAQGE